MYFADVIAVEWWIIITTWILQNFDCLHVFDAVYLFLNAIPKNETNPKILLFWSKIQLKLRVDKQTTGTIIRP